MNIFVAHVEELTIPNARQCQLDIADFAKSLAKAGLAVDQSIFFENLTIDLVLVVIGNSVQYDKVCHIANTLPLYSDVIYFENGNIEGSFFCKPSIFGAICNLYKIDFTPYKINGDSSTATFGQKLMCLINRLNLSASAF
jgi:hypothetical protein